MVSSDARRTLGFYQDVLGLDLVKKTVNFDDPSAYHLYFGNDGGRPGTILTFFEWPHARRGRWGIGSVHHLALDVATREGQLKWKRRLTDAGVTVNGPIDRGYFSSIYFTDPDGQILEIATAGPGYAIDEPIDRLGRELIVPPPERLVGTRDEEAIRLSTYPHPVESISDDMRLDGIHHITAITNDMERAGDFYESALGLSLVKKTYNQDDGKTKHYFWAGYDGKEVWPHSALTLFDWSGSTYTARQGTGLTHHIAFRAKNEEEQEAWREHLLSLGVHATPVADRSYFKSIYFRAPDGLVVEIATDGPGFAIDEPVEQLGEGLKLPSWLESRRPTIERTLVPLP
jgi:glyoxalase family protein